MNLMLEILAFAALIAAIPCLLLAVIFGALAILDRGATRLDRVLAQAERDRIEALLDDPALWESMERRVQP